MNNKYISVGWRRGEGEQVVLRIFESIEIYERKTMYEINHEVYGNQ